MPADGDRLNTSGLTDQQRRALDARGVSVALSAGAGCGKTFVLTRRFLDELTPEADNPKGTVPFSPTRTAGQSPESRDRQSRLGQIVAITFTERTAREMRDRIRRECRNRLQECPDEHARHWLDLIRELDSARISTIHSFCASLLRSHAVEAGIDPRFRVLDGAQAGTLLVELIDDLLRDRLAARNEAALALVARLGLARLRSVIARLLAVRQEIDWAAWRDETPERLVERWHEFWRRDTVPRLLRRIGGSASARTLLDAAMRHAPDHPTMRQHRDVLVEQLPKLCGAGVPPAQNKAGETPAPQELLSAIRAAAMVQGVGKKHWIDEDAYERFKGAAEQVRKAIDNVEKQMQFDAAAALPSAQAALQALSLAADAAEAYDRQKQELGVLDFNDLLIHAQRLLLDPEHGELRRRLAAQIRLLLVDEFQDTDRLQVEMVKALCDNEHLRGKLFFVGDHKQSIYRFRGARPEVFRELYDAIPEKGRLSLSKNFRSQPAILDFVNALFAEELPNYEPLEPSRPQVSPTPAVEFLWASENQKTENGNGGEQPAVGDKSEDSSSSANPQSPIPNPSSHDDLRIGESITVALRKGTVPFSSNENWDSPPLIDLPILSPRERLRRREADWIARRIRNMLDSGERIVWDEDAAKAGRPAARAARQGDFALLFRALTNVEYYEEALRRHGIDYYLVGGHAFYAQQEIYDLLNLLRTLSSPCDAVSFVGVLRSPMFGLRDETLFWLLQDRQERAASLLERDVPEEIDGPQRRQTQWALATLRQLRAMKDRLPVARLIQEALRRTGYDALLLAEFLGERKLANLHKLVEQARSFDRAGIFTLSDFIAQLSEFVARQPDEPLAATKPELADVVKLMTIHQSKGLEFPVVIVPDVCRPRRVTGPPIAFTPSLGPALKDPDAATGYDLFMSAENDEELQEIARLLYVAATRAADYLILSAGVEDITKPSGPWMEMLARRFDLLTGEQKGRGARGGGRGEGKQWSVASGQCKSASDQSPIPNPQSPVANPSPLSSLPSPLLVTAAEPMTSAKTVDPRRRRDLLKIVEKAEQMAADGQGQIPPYLAPVAADPNARRQYSFSRLTGMLRAKTAGVDPGVFDAAGASEQPLDARGLGTLVHAVLEEVDFARPGDLSNAGSSNVEELVRQLAEQHLSASERGEEESLAVEMIGRFLASPRAAALAQAKEIHRELEFLLAWPPGIVAQPLGAVTQPPEAASSDGRYLQGFIDCLYRDAGGWRLLDYKTSRVTADTLAVAAAPYEMQMLVYAAAAETILKTPPVELTLCFLRPGLEYRFAWDNSARKKVLDLVGSCFANNSVVV